MGNEKKKVWQRLARFYGGFMKKSDKMYDEIAHRAKTYLKKEMALLGINIYNKWTAKELVRYIEGFGFAVEKSEVITNGFVPLCCLIAKRKDGAK